jgi:ParB-like chromosome segregation protein Spo0J
MPAHQHISQKQLRNLIAGDFSPFGFEEDPIRVGQLVPEDVTAFGTKEHYSDLRDSIQEHGIQKPLVVHRNTLIDGHHRAVAAMELDLPRIPVQRED